MRKDTPEVASFTDYMKETHFTASSSSKYRLAHDIFYELGDIESAERTVKQGLQLSMEEGHEINKNYFTNAMGLIHLSKGDYDKALEQFEKSLELTDDLNQTFEKIAILLNIGVLYQKKKRSQKCV